MALTLKDVENRGLLAELTSCFDTEAAAQTLLARLEVPAGRLRPFGSMETGQWWRHVAKQLDRGLIEDGLDRLLRAAADVFPGNRIFAEYLSPRSELVESRSPGGQDLPEPLRVFLSYAREDRDRVVALYRRLEQEGFQPWMDEMDLFPGQSWQLAIRKTIREADVFLVLLSQHSSKRGFVQKEIRLGIETWEERPEGDIFLIPALLEAVEIPERLRHIHAVYLYEEQGFERLIKTLQFLKRRLLESHDEGAARVVDARRNLTISRIELTNIRCFERLDLRLEQGANAILLGDN